MEQFDNILEWLKSVWFSELFKLGETVFTINSLLILFVSLVAVIFITGKIQKLLVKKVFARYSMDVGVSQAVATIIRYILVTLGFVIILQSVGINLNTLGILIGALGIGIGFGLQNVTNNFISGIIILFERPVKVGDRIEVGDVAGNIIKISARSTTIITNDNIAIIVPNSDLTGSAVINWSHNDRNVRFNFPVGVSYNEDPEKIKKLLLEVANSHPGVLKSPPPDVLFEDFGDSSLDFNLRVWTLQFSDRPKVLKSQLYYEIFKKFKEHGVEIPFPQRDLHLKSGFGGKDGAESIQEES